jgi:hypothetical protein
MPKRSAKKSKHQSFKMTPHNHSKERVFFFVLAAALIGLAIGWVLKDQYVGMATKVVGY